MRPMSDTNNATELSMQPAQSTSARWKRAALRAAARTDDRFDALRRRLHSRLGVGDPNTICAYMGYAAAAPAGTVFKLRGRVLAGKRQEAPLDSDSAWANLLATYRRLESDEVPGAHVQISLGGTQVEAVTDHEGYYEAEITPTRHSATPWQRGTVRLLNPATEPPVIAEFAALHAPSADFAVISDIDDTILVSDVTHLLRAARLLFLQNARARLTFPGVAAFYTALQRGVGPASFNPIFYVSSSPWNLYDLLIDFMAFHAIPAGPLFLRDYGIEEPAHTEASGHAGHKLLHIEQLLADHPNLPFVLIGDSGQKDPEIYATVAARHPTRIRAIYIRDIAPATVNSRDNEVEQIGRATSVHGVPMLLVANTAAAHAHAAQMGLALPPASAPPTEPR